MISTSTKSCVLLFNRTISLQLLIFDFTLKECVNERNKGGIDETNLKPWIFLY